MPRVAYLLDIASFPRAFPVSQPHTRSRSRVKFPEGEEPFLEM